MFLSRYEPVEQPPDSLRDWSRHDAVTGTGYTFWDAPASLCNPDTGTGSTPVTSQSLPFTHFRCSVLFFGFLFCWCIIIHILLYGQKSATLL